MTGLLIILTILVLYVFHTKVIYEPRKDKDYAELMKRVQQSNSSQSTSCGSSSTCSGSTKGPNGVPTLTGRVNHQDPIPTEALLTSLNGFTGSGIGYQTFIDDTVPVGKMEYFRLPYFIESSGIYMWINSQTKVSLDSRRSIAVDVIITPNIFRVPKVIEVTSAGNDLRGSEDLQLTHLRYLKVAEPSIPEGKTWYCRLPYQVNNCDVVLYMNEADWDLLDCGSDVKLTVMNPSPVKTQTPQSKPKVDSLPNWDDID